MALLVLLSCSPEARSESRPVFPLPEGLYSDGETCGAAEFYFGKSFTVRDVMGDACTIRSVERQDNTFRFTASWSEGLRSFAHSWTADSSIRVIGPQSFSFDRAVYRFCSSDRMGATSENRHHADRHLPLVAGSYRAAGARCGALEYLDNPKAGDLGGMFGGSNFGDDVCTVKRADRSGYRVVFESTCIPTRNGTRMRISEPTAIVVHAPSGFDYEGRRYALCKRIDY